ncbi:hypothetical protein P8452_65454 [Trifolium repens]|nr:hypothetical protein P8452_65454 [Trifolium repens]
MISLISIILLCITIAQRRKTVTTSSEFSAFSTNIDGICKIMVETQGYICEEHTVTTEDGYILSIQRLPAGRSGAKATKPPILIQHGLFCDANVFLLNSPDESLAFILADSGFDVWLVNGRGTRYSTMHTSLTFNDADYWDWTWDDLASYDLPTSVQYVYDHTGQKMHLAAHSQGSLIALASFSQGKLLNIVRSDVLLSPIAHMDQISPVGTKLAASYFLAEEVYWLGLRKFLPNGDIGLGFFNRVCIVVQFDCLNLFSLFTGPNCCINSSRIDYYLQYEPQLVSTKSLIHFSQMIRTGNIAKYDYGAGNQQHYGQPFPPTYDLTNIPNDFPIFIGYGGADMLSSELKNHDPNKLVQVFVQNYAHADFIVGINAKQDVYDPMIDFFNAQ